MTLIISVNGTESIWMLADRRLSYKDYPPRDDACKLMFLETIDGVAILGYSGLGATALRTEPSAWMSSVLRGRNLPLEQSLGVIAEAMKRQFPRHMIHMTGINAPMHSVMVSAFNQGETRLYTIDLAFAPDRTRYAFRYTRHVLKDLPFAMADCPPPPIILGGSGAPYLAEYKKKWGRNLLSLVRAHDDKRISPFVVADYLASLNSIVHLGLRDKSVGPQCIVAWRYRSGGVHKRGGGHQFYTNSIRDSSSPALPAIARGMDVVGLISAIMPHTKKMLDAMRAGQPSPELNKEEIDAELARLPHKSDEHLR